jgi:uncharacterized protein with HEPN domain
MDRKTRKLLHDALSAIEEILEFTHGVDLHRFMSDKKTQRATYYAFAVLGEALSKIDLDYRPALTDYRLAVDMRNRLIHGYATVDAGVVWATVQQDIQNIRDELEGILAEN